MGNARWTGVKLRDLLNAAGMKSGFITGAAGKGLEQGEGPERNGFAVVHESLEFGQSGD